MTCPEELTLSIYADDELPRDEVRQLEMHLVSCRDCRHRIVALRDEMSALADAMNERTAPARILRERTAPAPELAWGLPAAIAAITAVLTIAGVLIEFRLPGAFDLLNPRRLMGVYEMTFDTVFMLRDRLPAFFDAAASVGAMASVSALGCAALHALSRRISRSSSSLTLMMLVFLIVPNLSRAVDIRHEENTHVGADQTISETLVCSGEVVTIDGTVDGDLVVAAERFSLRGTVTGNLIVFGSDVEIDGTVNGTLISAGERVNLSGRVDGAVAIAAERLNVLDEARIGRDVTLIADGARLSGEAARDVTFVGDWLEVRATIGRDLHVLGADRVALLDGASIGRDVRGRLWGSETEIEEASGARVSGEVQVSRESRIHEHYLAHYRHPTFYVMVLVSAAAAFLFGLLIYILDPRFFEAETPDGRGFARALGIGFVICLAGPVALFLTGMTVVGIPIAVLGLFILISALYTAYVIVAGMVGRSIVKPAGPGLGAFAPSLLTGVLIVSVLAALPFVGIAVRILAVLFGLGCLFERARGLHALNLRGIRG
jgi:cytoskeletal protein CcmA (bactofilin family)